MNLSQLHHIQKHILRVLSQNKWARFRDMRPPRVDSNLYNYHLKILLKGGMVEKVEGKGYRLSPDGLRYADHVSLETFEPRWQPKILTMVVSMDEEGRILLWPKYKQPFIDRWSLPSGKMHYDDESVETAIVREIGYLTPNKPRNISHKGVVEYRVFINHDLVTHTIAHLFTADVRYDDSGRSRYFSRAEIKKLKLSPGTKECIDDVLKHKAFFYTNYDIDF